MRSARESAAYLRQAFSSRSDPAAGSRDERSQPRPGAGRVSGGSLRRRAALKAHAQQGSSLPDAAAAAACRSSAAARRMNTPAPTPQHRQLQGEQRPARKIRQRRHARAQHFTCSINASGLAQQQQQQQQQPDLCSTAAAAKGAAELSDTHLGLQGAEGRKASEEGSEQLSEISCK